MKRLEVGPDYINNLVQLVQAKGCKPKRLYDQAGLAYSADEEAEEQPLDAPSYSRLYSEATQVVGDECFGFLGPGRIPCGTLSVFCEYLLPAHTLGEALHLLRLTGCVYARSELSAPWGVDLPPLEGHMMFHIVTAGRCWLEIDGSDPFLLERGSLARIHCTHDTLDHRQQQRPFLVATL